VAHVQAHGLALSGDVRIARGSASDLDSLEPLWVAVHRAHAASMPELAPYVSDAQTWRERRALYSALLEKDDTVLLLARVGDLLVGYALAHVMDVGETWIADTWRTGARVAEIESLSVAPGHRDRGIGSALMDTLEGEIAALGVADVIVGALAGNEDAVRLYRRRGYRPAWLYLARWEGR
jgi:ribosomal protein S18 acetylase RimI-like enzyme